MSDAVVPTKQNVKYAGGEESNAEAPIQSSLSLEMRLAYPAVRKCTTSLPPPLAPNSPGWCVCGIILAGKVAVICMDVTSKQESSHPHQPIRTVGAELRPFATAPKTACASIINKVRLE